MKTALVALFGFLPAFAVTENGLSQDKALKPECARACSRLVNSFGPQTHFPGNGNITVWDAKQQQVQSACRIMPTSAEDVSAILSVLLEESCNFAVKSGGHAQHADDSVSVNGVTVDLERMRGIEISPDRKSVRLGTGHKLHSLYAGLEKHGLTTLGGRAADVGLGGFVLGGGFSHLSAIYGLAMDNVFEYELVLPNATVVTVNENVHPDLYFALRGGMNNFGIVTRMTMRAVPQDQFYSGARSYTPDTRQAIIHQASKLTTYWKNDTAMSFYYSVGYNQTTDDFDISVTQEYSRPIMNPLPFEELNQIPFESDSNRIDWPSKFSEEVNSADPPGNRNHFSTVTYYPSPELDRGIQDIMREESQSVKGTPGFFPNLVLQPLFEASIRAQKQRGGSASGIDAHGPLTVVLLLTRWQHAEDDDAMNAFIDRWVERATAATRDAGKYHPWRYINYAGKRQEPFLGYGEENLQTLRNIQKSVDPRGVFTSSGLCKGFFKLN